MSQLRLPRPAAHRPDLRYVRTPEPLHFPESELVPESKIHLILRTFLYRLLAFALTPEHSVGCDQFVYWNASNPKRCLSPDAFVKLGVPDTIFDSWKTWEQGGVPELAVEILSRSDEPDPDWGAKLARYHELGVKELVSLDHKRPEGQRVRAWDRVNEDLVERVTAGDRTPCLTLGIQWVVAPTEAGLLGLRLADEAGRLLPVPEEAEATARDEAESKQAAAEARVLELERELRRLSRPS